MELRSFILLDLEWGLLMVDCLMEVKVREFEGDFWGAG